MRNITYLIILFGLTSCVASNLKIHKFSDANIDKNDKTFVYLSRTEWDNNFRIALFEAGFKVKKFSSTTSKRNNNIQKHNNTITEDGTSFNVAEARYGLSLQKNKILDWCPFNDEVKANFELEVSDLRTNDVILIIKKGNWTGLCGPFSVRENYIFTELALELKKQWK